MFYYPNHDVIYRQSQKKHIARSYLFFCNTLVFSNISEKYLWWKKMSEDNISYNNTIIANQYCSDIAFIWKTSDGITNIG